MEFVTSAERLEIRCPACSVKECKPGIVSLVLNAGKKSEVLTLVGLNVTQLKEKCYKA